MFHYACVPTITNRQRILLGLCASAAMLLLELLRVVVIVAPATNLPAHLATVNQGFWIAGCVLWSLPACAFVYLFADLLNWRYQSTRATSGRHRRQTSQPSQAIKPSTHAV